MSPIHDCTYVAPLQLSCHESYHLAITDLAHSNYLYRISNPTMEIGTTNPKYIPAIVSFMVLIRVLTLQEPSLSALLEN